MLDSFLHTMTHSHPHAKEPFLDPSGVIAAIGLHEGMKVADFGCGSGFFARAAARAVGAAGEVWAIDVDRAMLARLATLSRMEGLVPPMRVLPGDVEKREGSGLPPSSIDLVIAANVLFSVHHKEALVKEIARVLKVHGTGSGHSAGRAVVVDWSDSFNGMGPPAESVVSREEAKALLEEAGFIYMQDVSAGSHHWGLMMRKSSA